MPKQPDNGRQCLACQKPISDKKRKDTKFCNEYCRAAYHNAQRDGVHPEIKRINKILLKNCQILESMLGKREYRLVENEQMIKKGFNFNFFTQQNLDYRYVYHACYTAKTSDSIMIVKAFESVLHRD